MANASKAETEAPVAEPKRVTFRCRISKDAPFEHKAFGGKNFALTNSRIEADAEGNTIAIPYEGAMTDFLVVADGAGKPWGGPGCELARVKAAIARKVVRWDSKEKKRGRVLSVRVMRATFVKDDPEAPPTIAEVRNHQYFPEPGDEPLSQYVFIEEVSEPVVKRVG